MLRRCSYIALALLAGCAGQVEAPRSRIAAPDARLMQVPPKLSSVRAGDDAYKSDAACSAAYVEQSEKLQSLQTYVSTTRKRSPQ